MKQHIGETTHRRNNTSAKQHIGEPAGLQHDTIRQAARRVRHRLPAAGERIADILGHAQLDETARVTPLARAALVE